VTFPAIAALVEREYGAGWWYCPARWDTLDGFAPYAEVWRAWGTMVRARAWDRLNLVRAMGTSRAGDRAQRLLDADLREAFPDG